MEKNIPLIGMCVATLLLCLAMCITFHSKVIDRFEMIDKKLVEVDGRRNAQYGILKTQIKQLEREVANER